MGRKGRWVLLPLKRRRRRGSRSSSRYQPSGTETVSTVESFRVLRAQRIYARMDGWVDGRVSGESCQRCRRPGSLESTPFCLAEERRSRGGGAAEVPQELTDC